MNRRKTLKAFAAAAGAALVPSALAQSERPLVLVVTFPPGGSTDITARIVQPELQSRVRRPVVVETTGADDETRWFVGRPDGTSEKLERPTAA